MDCLFGHDTFLDAASISKVNSQGVGVFEIWLMNSNIPVELGSSLPEESKFSRNIRYFVTPSFFGSSSDFMVPQICKKMKEN